MRESKRRVVDLFASCARAEQMPKLSRLQKAMAFRKVFICICLLYCSFRTTAVTPIFPKFIGKDNPIFIACVGFKYCHI
ncbi:hypothetical protein Barb4_02763 [Bacteroidales bacterium Barb4]|nr:hypothetical protein Barb4_02763 [Bacteroidales bacterium Barb4]